MLRGWDSGAGPPHYDLRYRDVRIRNVLTNIRDRNGDGGTEFGGNSIFIFEIADLCIAHLSHLHHTLSRAASRGARPDRRAPGPGRRRLLR